MAISMFVFMNNISNTNINLVKNSIVADKALYESNFAEKAVTVSGAQIVSKIYDGLDVNIKVNGLSIPKTTDGNSFNYSSIDNNAIYKSFYTIDTLGKVTTITYTKM